MRLRAVTCGLVVLMTVSCARDPEPAGLEIPTGSNISVEKKDGVVVQGRLLEVRSEAVVLELDGKQTAVRRSEIARIAFVDSQTRDNSNGSPAPKTAAQPVTGTPAVTRAPAAASANSSRRAATLKSPAGVRLQAEQPAPAPATVPAWREVTVPAGTTMAVELRTTVGSESSRLEDQVRGTVARAVAIDGVEAIPAGAVVIGSVTEATRSGRVKGRARVAFRFSQLDLPGDAERLDIRTGTVAREAAATKKEDAAKIGGGAAAGALIGGIIGGGDGAAKGAVIGGGAGTAAVLSTRGDEVTLPAGTTVSVRLTQPVTVRIRPS